MKKLACGVGLALVLLLFSASPAPAFCYECRSSGYVCDGSGWCTFTYTCSQTTSLCGQCWESCTETLDTGCSVYRPCQWAFIPGGKGDSGRSIQVLLGQPAP